MGAGLLALGGLAAAGLWFMSKKSRAPQWHEVAPGGTVARDQYVLVVFDEPEGWNEGAKIALLTAMSAVGFDQGGTEPDSEKGLPPKRPGQKGILARWHGAGPLVVTDPRVIAAPPVQIPTANFHMYAWE